MLDPWTIVLAAGAGRRLASLTGGVPKQFWSGPGGRTLLQETIDRFAPISGRPRRVVIADRLHRQFLAPTADAWGAVVYQPADRGTATGVMLSLTPVLASDPDSVVVLTPSDHGVKDRDRFLHGILHAVDIARRDNRIVLFGIEPTASRDDYGWIVPGQSDGPCRLTPVSLFVEKPPKADAERLLNAGAVWNTMVVVARAGTLRDLCVAHVPQLHLIAASEESPDPDRFLEDAYRVLTPSDFSRDVLAAARDLLTYILPNSIGWSDLGTPERLLAWHHGSRRPGAEGRMTAA